jgi:hypothetical protein
MNPRRKLQIRRILIPTVLIGALAILGIQGALYKSGVTVWWRAIWAGMALLLIIRVIYIARKQRGR